MIVEGSPVTDKYFEKYELKKFAQLNNIQLFNINKESNWLTFNGINQNNKPLKIRYSQTVANSFCISLTVPKTHANTGISLSLKNMMGIIHPSDKKLMHGLSENITLRDRKILSSAWWKKHKNIGYIMSNISGIYFRLFGWRFISSYQKKVLLQNYHVISLNLFKLSKTIYPNLSIIDAFDCMEGQGPWFGNIVNLKTFVCSMDFLAADNTMCKIMGINPNSIKYLQLINKDRKTSLKVNYPLLNPKTTKRYCNHHSNYLIFTHQDNNIN